MFWRTRPEFGEPASSRCLGAFGSVSTSKLRENGRGVVRTNFAENSDVLASMRAAGRESIGDWKLDSDREIRRGDFVFN